MVGTESPDEAGYDSRVLAEDSVVVAAAPITRCFAASRP